MLQRIFRTLAPIASYKPRAHTILYYSQAVEKTATKQLAALAELTDLINKTPSTNAKHELLAKYPNCADILKRIYAPHTRFWISSRAVIQYEEKTEEIDCQFKTLDDLLDHLSSRQLTGNNALAAACAFLKSYCQAPEIRDIFFKVIDRNMRMGVSLQTLNRVFPNSSPDFRVALAMPFKGDSSSLVSKGEPWYASRKLDGVRCLATATRISPSGPWVVDCRSRTGRPFVTLQKVQIALVEALRNYNGPNLVFDGEICVYDESEHLETFVSALKQIKTLDKQMEKPVYQIFDVIPIDGFNNAYDETTFSKRLERLQKIVQAADQNVIRVVSQTLLVNNEDLINMEKTAVDNGWEGIMLRKDTVYEGKRRYSRLKKAKTMIYASVVINRSLNYSRNLLKLKQYEDSEYTVKGIETGDMRMPDTGMVEKVMTSVIIQHKGNVLRQVE
jgi:DNA ligase-1